MGPIDRRLLARARSARRTLAADCALGLGSALLVLIQASLLATVLARAFHGATLGALRGQIALVALAFAARGLLAWSFEVVGRRGAAGVLSELRLALLRRRLAAQPAALDGAEAGELVAASVQGVDALEAYFARYLPQLVLACVVPVAVLAWVAPIDAESALVMLGTLPLVPLFMWLIGSYTAQRTRRSWRELHLLASHFLDLVRGLPTLRAFNRAGAQRAGLAASSERYRKATMGTLRVSFLSGSVLELAATLGVALVAVTIGVRLDEGGVALRTALVVLILAPELYLPLRRLGAEFHASADGLAVAERILDLLAAPPEAPGLAESPPAAGPPRDVGDGPWIALPPSPAAAAVRFECVSFAYPRRPGLVLDGLELELAPGETVALVGPSGAGKSTVAMLLLGLASPLRGRISVGGVDLARCDIRAWRAQLAWVPQHPTLVPGTIADNVLLGNPRAGAPQVARAARLAGAEELIEALPDGYATVVGEGGRTLSAGERRRVALARAFLRDAPLVVLDEPTADLDPDSAERVAEALERLCPERTVLLIAHRPELASRADRMVELGGSPATGPAPLVTA